MRNAVMETLFIDLLQEQAARAKTQKDIQLEVFFCVTHTHAYMDVGTYLYYICSVLYLRIEGRQLTQILVCAGLIESCGWEG